MSFADMSGTTRTAISGTRSRTDSDMVMQSKLVRFLARNAVGPTAEIVLLDSDKLYHLNLNKKEYTEQSFEELRSQHAEGPAGRQGRLRGGAPAAFGHRSVQVRLAAAEVGCEDRRESHDRRFRRPADHHHRRAALQG